MIHRLAAWLVVFTTLLCGNAHAGRVVNLASTDYPPYFSPQLPGDGVVAAITRAALAKHGHTLRLHYRPWARLMAEVQAGQFDGVMAVWYEPARAEYLHYSQPLVNTVMGFYGRVDKPLAIQPLSGLRTRVIGTVRGYKNPDVFERAGLKQELAADDQTNLRKLAAGRLDLVLIDKVLAQHLLASLSPKERQSIRWQDPPLAVMPLHVGLRRQLADGEQLLADFNDGLQTLRKTGQLAALIHQYQLAQ
ncbi:MAG: substrate-binding periplasmic protein [Vogesella sp.]|uniref:substrate-binding periplasmic protein n=1 Tax=Vogesella sp. TaxID=1904252 RepID=UPI003F3A0346